MINDCRSFCRKILVIDDTESIHQDFDKILLPPSQSEDVESLDALDKMIFGDTETGSETPKETRLEFSVHHALQGEEGYKKVLNAVEENERYAVAFVDMRMPPGWDGLKTVEKIWKADSQIQIVICTAFSDYNWEEIIYRLGRSDRLLILKKPFDQAEVYQMATALTEKWNVARASSALRETLEEKVAERSASLKQANKELVTLNGELKETAREAQAATRAKGRFLATMSHEIRTTLNGVMGASYMLTQSDLNETDRDFARIIQSNGESLMTIINDILDYSKYESGGLQLERKPLSLNKLAKECSSLLKPFIEQQRISFSSATDSSIPEVLIGDAGRIRQILLNLLNNALKFSAGKSVTLAIDLQRIEPPLAWVRISITDTGIGMGPETQKNLFTAFMQADSSTTRKYGGTGLGLAICKLLADAMDAELKVESKLGEGSTFSVEIPLTIEETEAANAREAREAQTVKEEETLLFNGKRLLVVDDNPVNRKLAGHFLAKFDLQLDFAQDGEESVSRFVANSYDLILMDLQMPVLDGYEAAQRIRQIEQANPDRKPIPIIALTANAFPEIREKCVEAGMNDFLTKPLRIEELTAALHRWVQPASK